MSRTVADGVRAIEHPRNRRVLMPEPGLVHEGAASYDDRYVRTPDGWRIAHTGYRRIPELTQPLTEVRSLSLGTAYGESA